VENVHSSSRLHRTIACSVIVVSACAACAVIHLNKHITNIYFLYSWDILKDTRVFTYVLKSEKFGKMAVYILLRLFAIYSELWSEKRLIDHSSRGKSYRNVYVHSGALLASISVDVCVPFLLTWFTLLLLIFAKDDNVQSSWKQMIISFYFTRIYIIFIFVFIHFCDIYLVNSIWQLWYESNVIRLS